jgi:uncharacterized membrane protein
MESKAKAFGHPIHPMLIVFPLGLFITAVVCDILYLITKVQFFTIVSYYNIAGGIIGGLLAAVFGFRDWLAIPADTRAKRLGLFHGLGNVILVVLFLISWLIRRSDPNFVPSTLALIFSFAAILLGTFTAWLGGELVYRLNVAVVRRLASGMKSFMDIGGSVIGFVLLGQPNLAFNAISLRGL